MKGFWSIFYPRLYGLQSFPTVCEGDSNDMLLSLIIVYSFLFFYDPGVFY